MSKSKMDKLADALGVRMNKAFRLVGQESTQYMITKYGFSKFEDGQELPAEPAPAVCRYKSQHHAVASEISACLPRK